MANLLSQMWEILYVLGFRSTVLEYIPPPPPPVLLCAFSLLSFLPAAKPSGPRTVGVVVGGAVW